MKAILCLTAALLLLAPLALAHDPPRPRLNCQTSVETRYHDYLPPSAGDHTAGGDGNVSPCPKANDIELEIFGPTGTFCSILTLPPPVCGAYGTGIEQPFEYDGEIDHAAGGAFLFVTTGDGVTDGVRACFGWPSVGHHSSTIHAKEWSQTWGPRFVVASDHSRSGMKESPDCGDNYSEPCDPNPPPPSQQPFPVNVLADTVESMLYTLFGPGGPGCNPLDKAVVFLADAPTSGGTVPFLPGADGAYAVFLQPDYDNLRIPVAGHVWTV